MSDKEITPGKAAFEKWVTLLDRPYPIDWEGMPDPSKTAWEDVAQTAIDHHQEMHGCCNE